MLKCPVRGHRKTVQQQGAHPVIFRKTMSLELPVCRQGPPKRLKRPALIHASRKLRRLASLGVEHPAASPSRYHREVLIRIDHLYNFETEPILEFIDRGYRWCIQGTPADLECKGDMAWTMRLRAQSPGVFIHKLLIMGYCSEGDPNLNNPDSPFLANKIPGTQGFVFRIEADRGDFVLLKLVYSHPDFTKDTVQKEEIALSTFLR